DVLDNRKRALLLEDLCNLNVACIVRCGYPNKWNAGAVRAASVIHCIPEVPNPIVRMPLLNEPQAIGSGLGIRYAVVRNNGIELNVAGVASQRCIGFELSPAREDG